MSVTKIEQKREKKNQLDGNHIYKVGKKRRRHNRHCRRRCSRRRQRDKHEQIYSGKINRNEMKWK